MDDLGPKARDLCRVLLLLITISYNSSLSPAIWSPAVGAHGLTVQVWVVLPFALNRARLPWPSLGQADAHPRDHSLVCQR